MMESTTEETEVELITASLLDNSESGSKCDLYNDRLADSCSKYNEELHSNIDPEGNFLNLIEKETSYYTDEMLCQTLRNTKGLSIIHFNVRSLNANFRKLDQHLSQLDFQFDIIAVTETWFSQNTVTNVFNMKGYELFYVSRNSGKGGGVALYINSSLKCKKVENKSVCSEENFECVTVELSMEGARNVIISCIYRKPGAPLERFTEALEELYSDIKKNKVLYICGDFNVDLLKQDTHSPTKLFFDTMLGLGLFPLINKPSRITSQTATLIDNIFTNEMKHEYISGLVINDISDHLPVFALYHYSIKKQKNISVRHYRKVDTESIQKLIDELDKEKWNEVYSQTNVNLSYEYFLRKFELLLEKYCPMSVTSSKNQNNMKPWLTKALINACKKKNTMYRKFVESKLQADEVKYKVYKNKLTKILKAAERHYYSEQLNMHKNNMKATWKILNEVIRGTTSLSKFPDSFFENNVEISNKKDIANRFNNFFVNVGPDLAARIEKPADVHIRDYLPDSNANTMFLSPVSENEMINLVGTFGHKSSLDCHGITMSIIKKLIVPIAKPLTHICNMSFNDGIFPDLMKIAKVVPLFKSGKDNIFTNYRPVSLLPQFSKILEKLFNKRLDTFLNRHDILSENQYGFRENRSTSLALMELVEDLTRSLDQRRHTIGVFIDLKKAFDTIDHKILLDKLHHYGLRGNANNWIRSYLENRKQYVKFENFESDYMAVRCGVPQGSILGPKLFIIYINDMCQVSKCLKFILFADDTNIFCSGDDLKSLSKMVTSELNNLKNWFDVNRLSLNITKTNFMIFSNSINTIDLKVEICNTSIDRVSVTKFLGVLIDDKLTWKKQIDHVNSKVSKSMFLLNRAKHVLNYDAMLTLYNCIVLPYLTYCCELWGNTYKSRLQNTIILQKKIIRIVHGAKYRDHTNVLFYNSKLLKLTDQIALNVSLVMFKAYHHMLPHKLQALFSKKTYDVDKMATRQINKFNIPLCRTTLKQMCISVQGVKLWNSLSEDMINNTRTIHSFKKRMKHMFIRGYDTPVIHL